MANIFCQFTGINKHLAPQRGLFLSMSVKAFKREFPEVKGLTLNFATTITQNGFLGGKNRKRERTENHLSMFIFSPAFWSTKL